jgi:predicted TIM-barrel fold metal-dependent hydrolase
MFPPATLEFPFDTTRAVLSLLYGGTLARCHEMKFLFSHAGGTVPYMAARMARLTVREDFAKAVPDGALAELRRLYFDTALTTDHIAFASLLQLLEPDHVVFGSDFPQAPESTMIHSIRGIADLGLSPTVLRGIQRDNAAKLLPGLGPAVRAA